MEPSTATPTAPPTWRVVSFMAEPTPALARGSEPMIESVAGAMTLPIPRPISMVTPMMAQHGAGGPISARNANSEIDDQDQPGADHELVARAAAR